MVASNVNAARILWDTASRFGAAPAIVDRDLIATYDDLLGSASSIAAALVEAGVGRGQHVGIFLPRGEDSAAALFGVVATGAVAVMIDDALRPRQVEHMLSHSEAACLITNRAMLARQPRGLLTDATVYDVAELRARARGFVPVLLPGSDMAQIVYTSGSSGLPKGVMVSHANLSALTSAVNGYLEVSSADRVASLLPFSFVYGLGQLLCSVSTGATLVVERSPLASEIAATLRERGVTVVAGVPALWGRLLGAQGFRDAPLPSLRVMTNAGGPLSPATVQALRESQPHARLFLMYGLTEALRCTYLPSEEVDAHPDSIGRPIPGAEVLVLNEDGTSVAVGETGELAYRGATVTLGYWHDDAATAQVFRARPVEAHARPDERLVFTGDLVRRDEEGLLYYVGRRDRLIKTMGYRVSPHEVNSVLQASGEVADVEVLGEANPQWGTTLAAYVVLRPHGSVDRLQEYCKTELPRYMRPTRFVLRGELPLTLNGKHDLIALRVSDGSSADGDAVEAIELHGAT